MIKSILILLGISVVLLGDSLSLAHYIKDLKGMVLVKESMIPGKDVVLPKETPLFVQQTVSMYNWINNGKGTKLNIICCNLFTQYSFKKNYRSFKSIITIYVK